MARHPLSLPAWLPGSGHPAASWCLQGAPHLRASCTEPTLGSWGRWWQAGTGWGTVSRFRDVCPSLKVTLGTGSPPLCCSCICRLESLQPTHLLQVTGSRSPLIPRGAPRPLLPGSTGTGSRRTRSRPEPENLLPEARQELAASFPPTVPSLEGSKLQPGPLTDVCGPWEAYK